MMGFYVFITDQCLEDIRRHNLTKEVDKLKERLLREQRVGSLFDNFPPPYLKKRFARQQRLIAAERYITLKKENHVVVCFYRILIRGSDNYTKGFLVNPVGWGDKHLSPLASDEILEKWLNDNPPPPVPEKQVPDLFEKSFLWDIMSSKRVTGQSAEMVYESQEWITAIKDTKFNRRLINFPDSILDICTGTQEDRSMWPMDSEISIMARMNPDNGRVFLIAPIEKNNQSAIDRLEKEYAEILKSGYSFGQEELARRAGRAYPFELLLNKDLWISAEEDAVANLALSAEEATLLEDVHNYNPEGGRGTGLPLFINGRAGSGKSTVLQYLFADYLRHFLLRDEKAQRKGPLYLTCSPELLRRSRQSLISLVALNPQNTGQPVELTDSEIKDAVNESAQEFHEFLYSFLSDEEKESIFPRTFSLDPLKEGNCRVDYALFVRMWEKSFDQNPDFKKYSPELAWHVIRTYIKGMGTDQELETDDYIELDNREKSVSHETFSGVHETVWKKYSDECHKKQMWDDQDLARYLLINEKIPNDYVAIFCDEAQDFTRVELEILLRLSVFSERKLAPEEINRVPFVFAGDPFQTLNPTGFRWEAVKATFFQKFISSLDPSRQTGRTDINYKELHYNYRSVPSIVKFTNSIQALRSYCFHQSGIEPQVPWQHGEPGDPPCWFDWEKSTNLRENIERNQDVVLIIPCREGEEKVFVERDRNLREWVPMDESGVPRNVLSAIRAKGLEFDRVALYGFGDQAIDGLLPDQKNGKEINIKPEWVLPREYFVNRLYVAASRGKKQLFVIDSSDGYKRLWKVFEEDNFSTIVDSFSEEERKAWQSNLGGMLVPGTNDSWLQGRGDINAITESYETEGRARKDPYLLRSAAINYESLGESNKATLARALAYEYERNFEKAGDLYRLVKDWSRSLAMYWIGEHFAKISELARDIPEVHQSLENRFIGILQKEDVVLVADIFQDLADLLAIPQNQKKVSRGKTAWKNVIKRILEVVIKFKPSEDVSLDWHQLCAVSDTLHSYGYVSSDQLAFLLYQTEDYISTLEVLAKSPNPDSKLFRNAKSKLLIQKLKENPGHPITSDDQKLLSQFSRDHEDYITAAQYAVKYHGLSDIENILLDANQKGKDSVPLLAKMLLQQYSVLGEWTKLIRYLEGEKLNIGQVKIQCNFTLEELWEVRQGILGSLSTSDKLANAGLETIQKISKVVLDWVQHPNYWEFLHPLIAGAVLERVALDIDCLKFYEDIFNSPLFKKNLNEAAKRRWLVCKLRQVKREDEQEKTKKQALKHTEELIKRKVEWKISHPEKEPEYPDVEELDVLDDIVIEAGANMGDSPSRSFSNLNNGPISSSIGGLTFTFDSRAGRMKVQKGEFDTLSIHIGKRTCVSVDVETESKGNIHSVPEWNFICDLNHVDVTGKFSIQVGDEKLEFQVDEAGQ